MSLIFFFFLVKRILGMETRRFYNSFWSTKNSILVLENLLNVQNYFLVLESSPVFELNLEKKIQILCICWNCLHFLISQKTIHYIFCPCDAGNYSARIKTRWDDLARKTISTHETIHNINHRGTLLMSRSTSDLRC